MKLYTKTGDKGETSLLGGKRVGKCCVEMRVVGELDELNSALGVVGSLLQSNCHSERSEESLSVFTQSIQQDLFSVSSEIASLQTSLKNIKKISSKNTLKLENKIDELGARLPELKNFILPGGNLASAHLHMARAICRRAERQLVEFGQKTKIRPEVYKYLNRLSDFLFTAARWADLF